MKATNNKIIKQQVVYIPVEDLARAQQFYANVFDFDVAAFNNVEDPTGEKWSIFPLAKVSKEGTLLNTDFFFLGLASSPHLTPSDKGTIVFLPCDDVDETLKRVEMYGGKVIQGNMMQRQTSPREDQYVELYHAFFLDTEGNKVGLTHGKIKTIRST